MARIAYFIARIVGPTQSQFESRWEKKYESEPNSVVCEIAVVDTFPIQNVEVHPTVSMRKEHLERLLLLLRWELFKAVLSDEESPLEVAARLLGGMGNVYFGTPYQRLKPPPPL